MKVFIDANILISVLNKEYPMFTQNARLLSLANTRSFRLYSSPVCFAIAFYFVSKKVGASLAKSKIAALATKIRVAENREIDVARSANHIKIEDFEDGLEYYAACNANCKCIVTEDLSDFYFSDIEVLTSEAFLNKYALSQPMASL